MSEAPSLYETEKNNVNNSTNEVEKNILINRSETEKKPVIIHRTIILGSRVFEYNGPVNQDIIDLLDLIEANSLNTQSKLFIFHKYAEKINEYNEKTKNKLSCIKGLWHIDLIDLFLMSVWIIFYAIFCLRLKVILF